MGILAILAPQTKDLTFVFASSGRDRPEVTVLWNGSPETKVADDGGMLTLRVNESTKENPEVLVSEIPEKNLGGAATIINAEQVCPPWKQRPSRPRASRVDTATSKG